MHVKKFLVCIVSFLTVIRSHLTAFQFAPLEVIFRVAEKWFCKLRLFFRLEKSGSGNSDCFFLVGNQKSIFFQVAEPLFCHPQNHFSGCRLKGCFLTNFQCNCVHLNPEPKRNLLFPLPFRSSLHQWCYAGALLYFNIWKLN
jgi:hypothetical protein